MSDNFKDLFVSSEVLRALDNMGISVPTTIQKETIPLMMDGNDIIGIAPTGTGKTIAFGVPMLEYIDMNKPKLQELVLAPTRELAMQIYEELCQLAKYIKGMRIALIYGGQPISRQVPKLRKNPLILVATPGRLLDMMSRGHVSLSDVHTLVIDEADEMAKMGFIDDLTKIIEATPSNRQMVMFSATTNHEVMTLSWKYQHKPVEIYVEPENEDRPQIDQYIIYATHNRKTDYLLYLLDSNAYQRAMIFVNTKFMAQRLCSELTKKGYNAEALHGNIKQSRRTRIMNGYKSGKFPFLVCTDVAARGIDVYDVDAVFNYDLPSENEYYLHRIGRTGRAGKTGVSFTLLTFQESVRMDEIIKYLGTEPEKLRFDGYNVLLREDNTPFFEHI